MQRGRFVGMESRECQECFPTAKKKRHDFSATTFRPFTILSTYYRNIYHLNTLNDNITTILSRCVFESTNGGYFVCFVWYAMSEPDENDETELSTPAWIRYMPKSQLSLRDPIIIVEPAPGQLPVGVRRKVVKNRSLNKFGPTSHHGNTSSKVSETKMESLASSSKKRGRAFIEEIVDATLPPAAISSQSIGSSLLFGESFEETHITNSSKVSSGATAKRVKASSVACTNMVEASELFSFVKL
jgi:hypothetical protein